MGICFPSNFLYFIYFYKIDLSPSVHQLGGPRNDVFWLYDILQGKSVHQSFFLANQRIDVYEEKIDVISHLTSTKLGVLRCPHNWWPRPWGFQVWVLWWPEVVLSDRQVARGIPVNSEGQPVWHLCHLHLKHSPHHWHWCSALHFWTMFNLRSLFFVHLCNFFSSGYINNR